MTIRHPALSQKYNIVIVGVEMEECVEIVLCVEEGARSLTQGATGLADLIY